MFLAVSFCIDMTQWDKKKPVGLGLKVFQRGIIRNIQKFFSAPDPAQPETLVIEMAAD